MTAVHEPRVFSWAERMSRIAAYDVIRELVNTFDLSAPATVQFSPGVHGALAVYVDTDAERAAWLGVIGSDMPTIAGREVAVLSVQAARERLAVNTCESCGGEMTHRAGCPDEPIPYVPVAMPTGDRANADECARLKADEPTQQLPALDADLRTEIAHRDGPHYGDVVTVDPDLYDERSGAEVARMVAPQTSFAEALPRLQARRDDETFAQIVSGEVSR